MQLQKIMILAALIAVLVGNRTAGSPCPESVFIVGRIRGRKYSPLIPLASYYVVTSRRRSVPCAMPPALASIARGVPFFIYPRIDPKSIKEIIELIGRCAAPVIRA